MFLLPLAGVLLGRLARWPAGAVVALVLVAGAGAFGVRQAELHGPRMDRPRARPRTSSPTTAKPGQDFLIDNSWPFILRLHEEGKVRLALAVYDTYRVAHHQLPKPICRVDWFVAAQGAGTWSGRVRRRVAACGTLPEGLRSASRSTNIGSELQLRHLGRQRGDLPQRRGTGRPG